MSAVRYLIKCDECGVCSEQATPLALGEFWLCSTHEAKAERRRQDGMVGKRGAVGLGWDRGLHRGDLGTEPLDL
ncbi:hypothetical protein SEA_WONDERBOY_58 [Arthrobacter phage WonderBoy]|nr:hypothetical protein SEA_WONDERBOY_58 [Arthrobacter phage WonderBoy]